MFTSAVTVATLALYLNRVTATPSCDRSTPKIIANSYTAAQTSGSLKSLDNFLPDSSASSPSSSGISYTENRKTAIITTGIHSHALNLAFNRSLL